MNFQKRESPAGRLGISESVHIDTANTKENTTKKKKPPTKAEASIEAFINRGSLNTFEANAAYNDTCLHSCVSYLNKHFGLEFNRRFEDVGAKRPVKRYTPKDINEMKRILNNLRVARGAGSING
jgi:hypothetical protein